MRVLLKELLRGDRFDLELDGVSAAGFVSSGAASGFSAGEVADPFAGSGEACLEQEKRVHERTRRKPEADLLTAEKDSSPGKWNLVIQLELHPGWVTTALITGPLPDTLRYFGGEEY